jgi:hypothetical protein
MPRLPGAPPSQACCVAGATAPPGSGSEANGCFWDAGNLFETITSVPDGTLIGNYSLGLVPVNANTVLGVLPPGFNASNVLTVGNYQALYQYFPTSNFTQPLPLYVSFTVTVRSHHSHK